MRYPSHHAMALTEQHGRRVSKVASQCSMQNPSTYAKALPEQHGSGVCSGESVFHAASKQLCGGSSRAAWQVICVDRQRGGRRVDVCSRAS